MVKACQNNEINNLLLQTINLVTGTDEFNILPQITTVKNYEAVKAYIAYLEAANTSRIASKEY